MIQQYRQHYPDNRGIALYASVAAVISVLPIVVTVLFAPVLHTIFLDVVKIFASV